MEVEIVKFDNLGRGIGYINEKIIFVPKSIPGDVVNVIVTKEKKDYLEGKIINIIKPSRLRQDVICPYFNDCGGCDLLEVSLSENLEYKINKVNDILRKANIDYVVKNIIKCENRYNYRNKITLKVEDSHIGFYESSTHTLVEINYCYLCKDAINNIIRDISLLNIKNGSITIRCNYKDELLIIIDSKDKINNIDEIVDKHKIIGIIQNNKCIYGDDFFTDKINNYLFKVSYDAFFQVNPYICGKVFENIEKFTNSSHKVLDLYCGVGTLSIVASKTAKNVLGVEIVENAINDAFTNKSFNNCNNIEFICEDTKYVLNKIDSSFDAVILDPPRSGVPENILEKINEEGIKKIIYVSCNPSTLARDLKILEDNYNINEFILFDMFVNSEHVESFVVLERK